MNKRNLPVGISNFEKLRSEGYYYVDKTGFIADLLQTKAEVMLITRPRRFGKTLGMSMLASFFDIRKDSRMLFQGLEITKNRVLCDAWMNQYPTVFITLRQVDGLCFTDAYAQLVYEIALLYQKHVELLESRFLSEEEKITYTKLMRREADRTDVLRSLEFLTQVMCKHYGKKVILLIDEYDVPVAKADSQGYYPEMLDVMKGLMRALKDNASLQCAILTGCLKIAKESIFTGTNNFVSDSILHPRFKEAFGFLQEEVDQLLRDTGTADRGEDMRQWYDGYHFGDADVYCPWDVMNYMLELQENPEADPVSYWKNTSDNAIIRSFIDYAGNDITPKLEKLLSGGCIIQQVDENLTYDLIHSSEENLWSLLYLSGYLTMARIEDVKEEVPKGSIALQIPNAEIKEIFETTVMHWFDDNAKKWNRRALFAAVWNGDTDAITKEMNVLLRRTISYHDYHEDFYHAFLAGIFTGAGYMVDSNKEHGEGRSDVVVYDGLHARVAIFEAKYTKTLDQLESRCEDALQQIDERKYAEEFRDDYDDILCYGISFFKKRCLVRRK